jgi:hypothetical protein
MRPNCVGVLIAFLLLHLIEHFRKRVPDLNSLHNLDARDIRIFRVFHERRRLMFAGELGECSRVFSPIFRKSFQLFEHGGDSRLLEQHHRVVDVFVKVGVENADYMNRVSLSKSTHRK